MRRAIGVACVLLAGSLMLPAAALSPPPPPPPPPVVVALIDSGINPYSPAFRDRSFEASRHPSIYIPGYPKDAKKLKLSLNTRTLEEALAKDAALWERVRPGQLYWIPGTNIIGAISLSAGGRRCPARRGGVSVRVPPPAGTFTNSSPECPERIILDDHGHGTSTASRATGVGTSLAPGARLVAIEGLGTGSSQWAADQRWIDVQSNSWGFLTGLEPGAMRAFTDMAQRQLVVTASGNGLAFSGFGPEPTYLHALSAPGVVVAGGHDNGHVTAWSGAPAQVVADAFSPRTALWDSLEIRPDPVACCTSTATPYVAGAAAGIIARARSILGDDRTGIRDGVVARGKKNRVSRGPLADGVFTLEELREVLYKTAQARPVEGKHDGWIHPSGDPAGAATGQPAMTFAQDMVLDDGPGRNPYCQGCWTLPIAWSDVPPEYPAYTQIGYGAINEHSFRLASRVLTGKVAMPERPDEDAFFAQDEALRELIWGSV